MHSLTEGSLPSWWRDLEDAEVEEFKFDYYMHLFETWTDESLTFYVDLSDAAQLERILSAGASPGSLPSSAQGDLSRELWSELIATDPSLLEVRHRDALVALVVDNWDGVMVFDEAHAGDELIRNGILRR